MSRAKRSPAGLHIGNDPPLDLSGKRHALDDRRRISIRWLSATILTALTGAGVMAIAVIGAHDRELSFGRRPQMVQAAQRPPQPSDRAHVSGRKSDKLVRRADTVTAKQSFKTPTVLRAAGRDVIKVRSFARVSTPLLLVGGAYQDEIPAFNALKMLTDGNERGFEAPPPVSGNDPDAEVTLVTTDVASLLAPHAPVMLADDEVMSQVREVAAAPRRGVPAIPPQMLLARTLRAPTAAMAPLGYASLQTAPLSSLDVRMVEENVTLIPRQEPAAPEMATGERTVPARRGESLEALIRANGGSQPQARAVVAALRDRGTIQEGQHVHLLFSAMDPASPARQLARVMIQGEEGVLAIAALNDRGTFVNVAPPQDMRPAGRTDDDDDDDNTTGLALYNSIYETLLKNDVPRAVVDDLIRIFSSDSDTDFLRAVTGGDAIEMFYTDDDEDGAREVLFASLTVRGETKRYYRFVNPDDGSVDYFDEQGRSLRKFLLRKPVANAEMRSGFGMRRHPILGYYKMHTGVDWANGRVGEPIVAAGSGTVIKAGWDTGYGRRVEIQHANGYITTYSHMSAFGRNIQPGVRVRQGQVIGYIGSSGLSTGPHLHYEVIVNDKYVDPLRIRVPRGRELDGRLLAEFKRERERVDDLRQKAPGAQRLAAR